MSQYFKKTCTKYQKIRYLLLSWVFWFLISKISHSFRKTFLRCIQNQVKHQRLRFQKQSSGGVLQKKVFLEISQNSQENTCARASFLIKLQSVEHLWWLLLWFLRKYLMVHLRAVNYFHKSTILGVRLGSEGASPLYIPFRCQVRCNFAQDRSI